MKPIGRSNIEEYQSTVLVEPLPLVFILLFFSLPKQGLRDEGEAVHIPNMHVQFPLAQLTAVEGRNR